MKVEKRYQLVFDRKKKVENRPKEDGKVEICFLFPKWKRKYFTLGACKKSEFKRIMDNPSISANAHDLLRVLVIMDFDKADWTHENFCEYLEKYTERAKPSASLTPVVEEEPVQSPQEEVVEEPNNGDMDFIAYMRDEINSEKLAMGTRKHKIVVLNSLVQFRKIKTLSDLTPENILLYDKWLNGMRDKTTVTIHNYHKRLHKYVNQVYQLGYIDRDPYKVVHISHGKSKERQPLTEQELTKIKDAPLKGKEDKVRDLFIFAAYTGMSYADVQIFKFEDDTEKLGDMYFIDGSRVKTGNKFFTPILKPAMDVLKKYKYILPKISNQKLNDYLHLIETRLGFRKPLTFHVARHSFATMMLSKNIPIEKVARMLGHTDIKTTQIYAKIMKSDIQKLAESLDIVG